MSKEPEPLDFLKAVYLNEQLPLSVRMRAAIEAAPYVHPKLSAMAVSSLDGASFAAHLDKAILRPREPPRQIEHRADETVEPPRWSGPLPRASDGG
jgi:hypothetical protein